MKLATKTFSNEFETLFLSSKTDLNHQDQERLRHLCARPMDWSSFLDLVASHKVVRLVYDSLKQVQPSTAIPKEVMHTLRQQSLMTNIHAHIQAEELARLAKLFEEHEIPMLSLKGPALSLQLYGDVSYRRSCDLDIIIRRSDRPAAHELLTDQGYVRHVAEYSPDQGVAPYDEKDANYFSADRSVCLELHWSWTESPQMFSLDVEEALGGRTEAVTIDGQSITLLNREDNLLFLMTHVAKHNFACLTWLSDIRDLIEQTPNLNWVKLIARARELGVELCLLEVLQFRQIFFGLPIPEEIHAKRSATIMVNALLLPEFLRTAPPLRSRRILLRFRTLFLFYGFRYFVSRKFLFVFLDWTRVRCRRILFKVRVRWIGSFV